MVADPIVQELADVSRRCVCLHTRMAARAMTRAYDAALRPLGLEATQFTLLAALAANPAASVTALADELALERSSLSRNLALLSRLGLAQVIEGEGRAVRHRVTPEGLALLTAAMPLWRKAQDSMEARIGGGEGWTETRRSLRRLRKADVDAVR
jgi:DNA-binding MarR family transcriptional regulator